MRIINLTRPFILIFGLIILGACGNDGDKKTAKQDLIGTWLKSDASTQYEYKLHFQGDNEGFEEIRNINEETSTSSARAFEWALTDGEMIIDFDAESVTTPYIINSEGELRLSSFTDHFFTKVE